MQCGAAKAEEEAPAVAALPDDLKKVLKALSECKFGAAAAFKKEGVSGSIAKGTIAGYDSEWVKSDKVYEGMKKADWDNYNKFLAESSIKDKAIKVAEVKEKNADGTASSFYAEMKLGMMISNRDMHSKITKYAMPADIKVDDMKVEELTVWSDFPEDKRKGAKKTVRMKVLSFILACETEKGYRTIDFDNYNFSGSLPTKITNKFVGNADDYATLMSHMVNIKKNGGKFK